MIQKMADYIGVSPQALLIGLAFFAVAFVIIYIKISLDEKKGVNPSSVEVLGKFRSF